MQKEYCDLPTRKSRVKWLRQLVYNDHLISSAETPVSYIVDYILAFVYGKNKY